MDYKKNIAYRKESLTKLLHALQANEEAIVGALFDDFKKPAFEAVVTETSYVIADLKNTIKNIQRWAKPKKVLPSLLNFPSSDYIYSEPYGKVLIFSAWNYPYQLALCPLIAAVAAGNQVVLKPSEGAPYTSAIIAKIISEVFDDNHVRVEEGGVAVAQQLLTQRWDYIFFTGSTSIGKIVAQAAAQFMTPVTLELGGKNPCIVDQTANLKLAAKRIVWGKFINAGQTCIAPDFLVVHQSIKAQLIECIKEELITAYGNNPESSPDLARIINLKNYQRLTQLLVGTKILFGGEANEQELYIAPTLVDEPPINSPIMCEEIFGPLLPILSYETADDIQKLISNYEKPLALYVFSTNNKFSKEIISNYSFGGGCINDTLVHFTNKRLPFGGVGHSGIGGYHGKYSFDTFSHKKAIVYRANWIDLTIRYAPYKNKLQKIKKLLTWL
ncbi:aldehyde dehydrogenase [Flavobacterium sp. SUN046]|uniref:aldehyde dehydrogenase n=1 Tax=Flavobacterium sp. SUN046 TaxID=3002440 RepID=UPI002DBD4E9C|nr:aldehyde dehydrogenase [Flavobacterium sp. SUN046]MEC4050968.1 aldehyde dehydrogenase [Flavobacterium sp. SUN046]